MEFQNLRRPCAGNAPHHTGFHSRRFNRLLHLQDNAATGQLGEAGGVIPSYQTIFRNTTVPFLWKGLTMGTQWPPHKPHRIRPCRAMTNTTVSLTSHRGENQPTRLPFHNNGFSKSRPLEVLSLTCCVSLDNPGSSPGPLVS